MNLRNLSITFKRVGEISSEAGIQRCFFWGPHPCFNSFIRYFPALHMIPFIHIHYSSQFTSGVPKCSSPMLTPLSMTKDPSFPLHNPYWLLICSNSCCNIHILHYVPALSHGSPHFHLFHLFTLSSHFTSGSPQCSSYKLNPLSCILGVPSESLNVAQILKEKNQ